ncbi:MAG: NFACT family protein [Clostridia bacterium]
MPFDASAVRCTAYEINKMLQGGRIEKIYQPENDEIVLLVKCQKGNVRLVISANSQNPRIYITTKAKENPQDPPMFCMLMRKHITSGRILSVQSMGFERIIDISVEARNELGDMVEKHIMCEIMGKNSNIMLLSENGKIIDSVKHVDLSVSRVRNVFPGLRYTLPPDGGRKNPLLCTEEDFYNEIQSFPEGKNLDKALVASFLGVSPLQMREVMHKVLGRCDILSGELTDGDKKKIAKELSVLFEKIKNNVFTPLILYKKGEEKPIDFAVYPINQYGEEYYTKEEDNIFSVLELFYEKRDRVERMRSKSYALMKTVTGKIERTRKKLLIWHDTLKDCEEREKYKIAGDIITANLYSMKTGDKTLTAVNYYDENLSEITIALDESKSPSKNAQMYYKKYQKAKTAETEGKKQIEKATEDLDYLESVVHEIENAKTPSELEEIRLELVDAGIIKVVQSKKKQPKKNSISAPCEYKFKGYSIFSGKNNLQNDHLTLKMGRANDLWLHTKNIPGSHVLIKYQGEDFPKEVIEAAAIVAATNSKAKEGAKTDVDYCPVSHVKKPNGAKAGMVIYEGYFTATVTPDEKFCDSIKI